MTTVTLSEISNQSFRWSLSESKEVYWAYVRDGVYLGYRKGARKCAWVGRVIKPDQKKYWKKTFGETDCLKHEGKTLAISFEDSIGYLLEWSSKLRTPRKYKGSIGENE